MAHKIFFLDLGIRYSEIFLGFPMDLDPAPYFSKSFLHYYQSKLIQKLKKLGVKGSTRFANGFRFMNDITAINDEGATRKFDKKIWKKKKRNICYSDGPFLDLVIKIDLKSFNSL